MIFICGLLASIGIVAIALSIHQRTLSILTIVTSLFILLQYFLLDRQSAVAMTVIAIICSVITLFFGKNEHIRKIVLLFSITSYIVIYCLISNFSLTIDLLTLVGSITMTLVVVIRNPVLSKILAFIGGLSWTIYQVNVGAYGQLFGEIFYFIAIALSSVMLFKTYKNGQKLSSTPEIGTIICQRFNALRFDMSNKLA